MYNTILFKVIEFYQSMYSYEYARLKFCVSAPLMRQNCASLLARPMLEWQSLIIDDMTCNTIMKLSIKFKKKTVYKQFLIVPSDFISISAAMSSCLRRLAASAAVRPSSSVVLMSQLGCDTNTLTASVHPFPAARCKAVRFHRSVALTRQSGFCTNTLTASACLVSAATCKAVLPRR